MSRFLIIGNSPLKNHPDIVQASPTNLPTATFEAVIDLVADPTNSKEQRLIQLLDQYTCPIFMETSCAWGEFLLKKYLTLAGCFSFHFSAESDFLETETSSHSQLLTDFFILLGKQPIISQAGLGFTFPRTLVQIINEAYFTVEAGVASREDIDRAMCYGVNYPQGPFAWASSVGLSHVLTLLDELKNITGESRYRACTLLRQEANL